MRIASGGDQAMTARGKLIVFEGPDGVGKTTLCRQVATALQGRGIEVEQVHLPGSRPGTFGKFVYDIHHHPTDFVVGDLDPTSLQVLHASAHIDTIARQIAPALTAGRWVLLDRFWWSTVVYGRVCGANAESLDLLRKLAEVHWRPVMPSIAFLVTRAGTGDARLAAEYESLFRSLRGKYPRVRLANDRPIDQLVETVLAHRAIDLGAERRGKHNGELRPGSRSFPHVWVVPEPVRPSPVFDTYWRFAAERQEVLFRRLAGMNPPWTSDPVIRRHRFTNAYRAADRVSQYLIRRVIYGDTWSPRDLLFRILLFKLFNKIETWELLEQELGAIDASGFSPKAYSRVLREARSRGMAIYSAAYIMASGKGAFGHDAKHDNHLALLRRMLDEDLPARVQESRSLSGLFNLLAVYPGLGPFLAFQYAIDINYSTLTDFDEMSFVVPGPGARDGIAKCFVSLGGLNEAEVIRWTTERQVMECGRLGLKFRQLGNRPLQLIDCQNLFCEVDKYARVAHPEFIGRSGRTRIKQIFSSRGEPLSLWFPPKWGINQFFRSAREPLGGQNGGLFQSVSERRMALRSPRGS